MGNATVCMNEIFYLTVNLTIENENLFSRYTFY